GHSEYSYFRSRILAVGLRRRVRAAAAAVTLPPSSGGDRRLPGRGVRARAQRLALRARSQLRCARSAPGPPSQRSPLPPWPESLSRPASPNRRSLPPPPLSLSRPRPAQIRSLPPRPTIASRPAVPTITSARLVPLVVPPPVATRVAERPLQANPNSSPPMSTRLPTTRR